MKKGIVFNNRNTISQKVSFLVITLKKNYFLAIYLEKLKFKKLNLFNIN